MRIRLCNRCKEWTPVDEWKKGCPKCGLLRASTGDKEAPMVINDIKPYKSMIDGTVIKSRSHHREHLKQHGCIEVGNEIPLTPRGIPDADAQHRKELIVAQIQALGGHEAFKRAVKKDVEFIKWNSRGLKRG